MTQTGPAAPTGAPPQQQQMTAPAPQGEAPGSAPEREYGSVPKRFVVEKDGKRFVLYAGLLELAHERGIRSMTSRMEEAPHDGNAQTCVFSCELILEPPADMTEPPRFVAYGDASPKSVAPFLVPHLRRMAETRAKARALRDATNVGMTSVEEMGMEDASGYADPMTTARPNRPPAASRPNNNAPRPQGNAPRGATSAPAGRGRGPAPRPPAAAQARPAPARPAAPPPPADDIPPWEAEGYAPDDAEAAPPPPAPASRGNGAGPGPTTIDIAGVTYTRQQVEAAYEKRFQEATAAGLNPHHSPLGNMNLEAIVRQSSQLKREAEQAAGGAG